MWKSKAKPDQWLFWSILMNFFVIVWWQKARRSLDFILDTVSAKHSLGPILELLKVNGTLVFVGAPEKPIELPSFPLIFGNICSSALINKYPYTMFILLQNKQDPPFVNFYRKASCEGQYDRRNERDTRDDGHLWQA